MDGDDEVQGLDQLDGERSTDGANIGDRSSWFRVDCHGFATAVPALPLIAQLLLALFLMAGGSRLYRRRQRIAPSSTA